MNKLIQIGDKVIGNGHPSFIIAEMSGNHNQNYERAKNILLAAKNAGVDAIKLQTYTADTITLNSDNECFMTNKDGLWAGRTMHDLYSEAYTPWEWQPKLKKLADDIGLILFSSPFDETSVDFLEDMNVPAYKIASFEINDVGLIRKVAQTKKPIIISTGIADLSDISLALKVCKEEENENVILLKCASAYPAPYSDMNLSMIPNMKETFGCCVGISDHSLGDEIAIASVALGANVVEKHFTLRRSDGGVDSAFSMEADEMKLLVERVRHAEQAIGQISYELTEKQVKQRRVSRSLFVCKPIKQGDPFTKDNIRSVRPSNGLHTKYLDLIIGKTASHDLDYGTPLNFADISW